MSNSGLRFSHEHEWVRLMQAGTAVDEKTVAVVGISDFAQEQLNDIVSVELPKKGTKVKRMQAIAIVDSVKASSDIYSPLSGEIVEANEKLLEHPEWINQSPYDLGWIVKIQPDQLSAEIGDMMNLEEYKNFTGKG